MTNLYDFLHDLVIASMEKSKELHGQYRVPTQKELNEEVDNLVDNSIIDIKERLIGGLEA